MIVLECFSIQNISFSVTWSLLTLSFTAVVSTFYVSVWFLILLLLVGQLS